MSGSVKPAQQAELKALAKELDWKGTAAFFKARHVQAVGQLSEYSAALGIALLKLFRDKGEAAVFETAERLFGGRSLYGYSGSQFAALSQAVGCPF